MVARVSDAIAAYSNAASQSRQPGLEAREQPADRSFADMVQNAVVDAAEAGRRSEVLSGQALVGRADVTDVVMAVSNAEMTLQTVVSIRDRVIEAYQEVVRMPI